MYIARSRCPNRPHLGVLAFRVLVFNTFAIHCLSRVATAPAVQRSCGYTRARSLGPRRWARSRRTTTSPSSREKPRQPPKAAKWLCRTFRGFQKKDDLLVLVYVGISVDTQTLLLLASFAAADLPTPSPTPSADTSEAAE